MGGGGGIELKEACELQLQNMYASNRGHHPQYSHSQVGIEDRDLEQGPWVYQQHPRHKIPDFRMAWHVHEEEEEEVETW